MLSSWFQRPGKCWVLVQAPPPPPPQICELSCSPRPLVLTPPPLKQPHPGSRSFLVSEEGDGKSESPGALGIWSLRCELEPSRHHRPVGSDGLVCVSSMSLVTSSSFPRPARGRPKCPACPSPDSSTDLHILFLASINTAPRPPARPRQEHTQIRTQTPLGHTHAHTGPHRHTRGCVDPMVTHMYTQTSMDTCIYPARNTPACTWTVAHEDVWL